MILAFAGYKGSGKSEAVRTLTQLGFTDVKMAAPLKLMLRAMYEYCGLDDDSIDRRLEGDLKELPDYWLMGKTPRHAMQQLGTEWRRSIDDRLWIPMWEVRVHDLVESGCSVACSDIRFDHEVRALHRQGGRLVWIDRPGTHSDGHASEQSIRHLADVVIQNAGTREQLNEQIRTLTNA